MIDYLSDIKPLEDAGKTDIEIAEHMSSRTATPILCGDAKVLLEELGVVVEDPISHTRTGTLIDHYNTLSDGPNKSLIAWFITHVFGRGTQISSHTQPRAVQLAGILGSLPGQFSEVGTKLIELGGGQPDAGTVDSDIAQIRTDFDEDVLRLAALATVNNRAGDAQVAAREAYENGDTPAQIITAAENAWSA